MFRADLHVHSTFSDGKLSIPELVDLYGSLGFGALAITDHLCEEKTVLGQAARFLGRTLTQATFPLYKKIIESEAERAWSQYKMVLIPGFELTQNTVLNSRSAHIVGLGVSDFIHCDADSVDLTRSIRAQGGLAVAAHPVHNGKLEKQTLHLWSRRRELASEFDAWEVGTGTFFSDDVLRSGLPMLATGDVHAPRQINSWKTIFTCEKHPEAIFDAIRNQDLSFEFYQEVREHDLLQFRRTSRLGFI